MTEDRVVPPIKPEHLLPNMAGTNDYRTDMYRHRAETIVAGMVHAMRRWGREEDGIPEEAAEAYCAGMTFLNWEYGTDMDREALRIAIERQGGLD